MNREPIYAALFALVSEAPGLITTSRKLQHWADVPATRRPALFQAQVSEAAIRVTRQPTRWMLAVRLYVYVATKGAASPGEVLNPILDYIEAALADPFPGQAQTLGGLVEYARIEGLIETSEGTLGDDEVCIIPVMVLTV